MFILDFPRLHAWIDLQYLTNNEKQGRVEGYVFAVTLIESRPLLFTVHLVDGAVYSRIPLDAIAWKKEPKENSFDRWGAISSHAQIIQHAYLKDYQCELRSRKYGARYFCTIDYLDGGFAQDPEQHKTTNIMLGDRGNILALPNNEILFLDDHFTTKQKNLPYRRNKTYWV